MRIVSRESNHQSDAGKKWCLGNAIVLTFVKNTELASQRIKDNYHDPQCACRLKESPLKSRESRQGETDFTDENRKLGVFISEKAIRF